MIKSVVKSICVSLQRSIVSAGTVIPNWILAIGKWNDKGKWDDNAKWKD